MHVLLVDYDVGLTKSLRTMLQTEGFVVDHVDDPGEAALEHLRQLDYDIALLNLGSEAEQGVNFLKELRAARVTTPVLVHSRSGQLQVKLKAFRAGADDYMVQPFEILEVQARMHAIVRRSHGYAHSLLCIGSLQLNLATHELHVDEKPVGLSRMEFTVLHLLCLRYGQLVTKEALMNHLYGTGTGPQNRIIDTFVHRLRMKLSFAKAQILIRTIRGRGFMLCDPKNGRASASPARRKQREVSADDSRPQRRSIRDSSGAAVSQPADAGIPQ